MEPDVKLTKLASCAGCGVSAVVEHDIPATARQIAASNAATSAAACRLWVLTQSLTRTT